MKFVLINPNWNFENSIYFGCREPHLPLEFGYAAALLRRHGHEAQIIDAHLFNLSTRQICERVEAMRPDVVVVTTAPNYLFWRCPPPELRIPQALMRSLRATPAIFVAVGPHGSTTPASVLRKLDADAIVLGEFEEILPHFSNPDWRAIPSIAYGVGEEIKIQGPPATANLFELPPLVWPNEWVELHRHHHHRFDSPPIGPGAVIEASRGCPYHCTFCAKENFRGIYRRRSFPLILRELDGLIAQGVDYVYFIDEIFLPEPSLLSALAQRSIVFGIQTRIDLWSPSMLEALGRAGCKSIEAGVESLTEKGRAALGKPGRLSTEEITERLIEARRHVPFVQANLIGVKEDSPAQVSEWREKLLRSGVWANDPVPLFPYPGSADFRRLFGPPGDNAWEIAHSWYLQENGSLSDLQSEAPLSLTELETAGDFYE
jgi:anaerobic magnesium-protoporphyrin IX monomethyl ester cyclase